MRNPVQGIHHITVMASHPQRNIDFYTQVLGQRMVKVTVNFDDPGTYHLYYGDRVGTPGTIMTFFPWYGAKRGQRGNGEAVATGYTIRPQSLLHWTERLQNLSIPFTTSTRFGETVLTLEDPDGMLLDIVASSKASPVEHWENGPIEAEHALQGFHGVTLWVENLKSSQVLLETHLGMVYVGSEADPEGTRHRFEAVSGGVGSHVDVVERPGKGKGRSGAGTIHHVAMRTVSDDEQQEYMHALFAKGYGVTRVQDRQYFHSIYFRDLSGVLFEIATDAPGFAVDEPETELGKHLKLPEWYEPRRTDIENHVRKITSPEYGITIGNRE